MALGARRGAADPGQAPAALHAPWWLPGGHAQTVWSALFARPHGPGAPRGPALRWRRERHGTPDGDFVDIDQLDAPAGAPAPQLVLFHGLEGSSRSHYAQALGLAVRARGWRLAVPHFRGCSGEPNRAPRAYHSGDAEEIGWMLERLAAQDPGPRLAIGVSLGGNALLRWAQQQGEGARRQLQALAAVCAPLDLSACGHAIDHGLNHWLYGRMFLRSMKPKAAAKLAQHPGLFDGARAQAARSLHDFDDAFTAPVHGFRDVEHYWREASAGPHLAALHLPSLLINPLNDPFVPAASLPPAPPGPWVTLWRPRTGGHVGFAAGRWPGHLQALPQAVLDWFASHL